MSDEPFSLIERFRMWLGGQFFLLAGRLHSNYDVWLDSAEPRHRKRRG